MKKFALIFITPFLLASCAGSHSGRIRDTVPPALTTALASPEPVVQLSEINLAKIGALAPKGRVQDRDYNQLPVVEQLILHGKESIPFLIGKLEDETRAEGHIMDYWSDVRVGDVAFVILTDFFTDSTWQRATIPDGGWDEFLGRGKDKNLPAEQLLRRYIARHGRRSIRQRWQQMWEQYKDKVYWDVDEKCFEMAAP